MSKFALREINQIKGKKTYYKLVKNGKCEFQEFCNEIVKGSNYESELKTLFSWMDRDANLQPLPSNKKKDITPDGVTPKEHEFKSKNLRIYTFQDKGTGKIVVCGGNKNTQDSDIRHFRKIKEEYLIERYS